MLARRDRRWTAWAAALCMLALVGGAAWLVLIWYRHGAVDADPRASVLGFLLAVAVAAVGLGGWIRRQRGAAGMPVTADQVGRAAATLAEMVAEQWAREALARSLGNPEPMPVRWRLSPTMSGTPVMDHPEMIAAAGLSFTVSSERISEVVAAFRGLDRHHLVITGGAGTGKTTLAVQLLLELLAHPRRGEPVPVLFSLVGWDPRKQPRLQDWLVARLERDYPALRSFGEDTARALVERGKILPILDGLDELPVTLRADIVTALNDAVLPGGGGLILTSRRAEFAEAVTDAGDVLTAAAVIAPLALTRIEGASYLRKLLPPDPGTTWSTVLSQLETGTAADLAAVTASPLGLWLVRTVYVDGHRDPTPLIEKAHPDRSTRLTLKAHLLDQLIPAVLASRPPIAHCHPSVRTDLPLRPRHRYRPHDVRKWLTTLALELRAAETRDWLWWHLARHNFPTVSSALAAKLAVGSIVGLAFGLAGRQTTWLVSEVVYGVAGGLVGGLTFGLVVGLVVGLAVGLALRLTAESMHTELRLGGRVRDLERSLGFALASGLAFGLSFELEENLPGGLLVGLSGLAVGLAFRLTGEPARTDLRLRGRVPEVLRSLRFALGFGLAFGLAFGLPLSLVGLLKSGPLGGLVYGLAFGLAFGPAGGLTFGLINFGASRSVALGISSPTQSQHGDRRLTVLVTGAAGLAFGLGFGFPIGLACVLVVGPAFGLAFGLVFGPAGGLAFGLAFGLVSQAWPAFLAASGWLAIRRRFPWRLMTFLDDAHRLGLLRVVGSAYQFRHAELQDHLAPLPAVRPK